MGTGLPPEQALRCVYSNMAYAQYCVCQLEFISIIPPYPCDNSLGFDKLIASMHATAFIVLVPPGVES